MTRKARALALFAVAGAAACFPGARAPEVAPQHTLELSSEAGKPPAPKPFGVVFASPKGQTEEPSEVTIVFNRPMHPLEQAGEESTAPAKIVVKGTDASPPGAWRWMGTSALVFAAEPRLARATEYVVTVPAGTKAMDGSSLASAYSFSFATPRPKVLGSEPREDDDHVAPTQPIDVRFDQPVDPREVSRAVKIVAGEGNDARVIAFHASWPKPDERSVVRLAPDAPLPLASKIAIAIGESLHGIEGPLPIGAPETIAMRTYGPLAVKSIDCPREEGDHGKCIAGSTPHVELSNAVPIKDFQKHVRVEPALPIHWPSGETEGAKRAWLGVPAHMKASRSYRVVVTAGLKDEYGQALARDSATTLDTAEVEPEVQIGLEGQVFEASAKPGREVPVASINVGAYDVVTAPLDARAVATFLSTEPRHSGPLERFDHAAQAQGAHVSTIRTGGAKNADVQRGVPLASIVGPKGRGVGLLGVKYTDRRGNRVADTRVVSVTDVAISAKMSRFGSLAWVTRLSDAKPIAGATVAVVTRDTGEIFTTTTDAQGLAAIPADKYSPVLASGQVDEHALVVARVGDDWSYRRVVEMLSPWRYDVSSDPSGRLLPIGMAFTERGVYRPGETVRAKAIFRLPTQKGSETPAGRDVQLVAYDGSGNKFFEKKAKLDAFGAVAVDVPVPATARLGSGEFRAEIDGAANKNDSEMARGAVASFELAAYKPAEFKVAVDPDKPSYVRGDKATFAMRGDYLFGAPMSSGTVRFTATRSPSSFTPPGAEGFVVDDETYAYDIADTGIRAEQIDSGKDKLDAKGGASRAVTLAMPNQHGPEMVTFEAEVEDVSRQTVASRASVVVHPGEFYVAIKPPQDLFVAKGDAIEPAIEAIDPSGRVRAGVPVHVDLIRRTWQSAIEASGEVGRHWISKPVDKTIASCDVTTAAAPVRCKLTASEVGYLLVRATAKDARSNPIAASTSLYALGESTDMSWRASDSTKVDLVADKRSYEIGDTARILVKSPFKNAEALVTIERSGIYKEERVVLSGATPTIRVPITDDMRPNAYVSVTLIRGRTKEAPRKGQDVGAPAFALGYAELTVNPEARRLHVAVTPSRAEYKPGEEVDVAIDVTDRDKKPAKAQVTFFAVDEGVLMLTAYKTPDPIPVFTAPRPLAVFGLETRADLARTFVASLAGNAVDKGDEGGGGGGIRSDLRATAHFEPSIVTGADGKARVHFKLADNLTTYRLMAVVAAEDDRFGFGEGHLVTSRPLMVRPALPRFVRAGDAIEAGVVVSSKGMAATKVDVTLQAAGLALSGDAKKTIDLPANGNVEVRWSLAAPNVGNARLTFKAQENKTGGGGQTDAVQVSREVKVPLALEAVALSGDTKQASAEKLGDLRAMRSDVGQLDLKVAPTALVGLGDGAEQLIEYPYGCTEQLTSRLVPLLPLRALTTAYNVPLPKNVDGIADEAIAKILLNQRPDGSFGYWPDSQRGDVWVTAYATWGLDIARRNGRPVPNDAIDLAVRYLRKQLAEPKNKNVEPLSLPEQAFVVDVLATIGQPDPGYTNKLYDKRAELPLFARALLAHAIATAKMDKTQAQELVRDLDAHLRITPVGATVLANEGDAYRVLLDSEARTTAMVIRALAAIDPEHALLPKLARGLLGMRCGGRWASTQEAAWALLALDDYRKVREANAPDFDAVVWFDNDQVLRAPFHARGTVEANATVPASKVFASPGATLAFQVQGKGELFYEARLKYARKELPKDAIDRGFFVRKLVRAVKPEALSVEGARTLPASSATSAQAGDLVLVDLIVVTPDAREQVVIEDPLPAGVEPIQAQLATTAQSTAAAEDTNDDADDEAPRTDIGEGHARGYSRSWFHREVHDDKVVTFVEHMAAGMYRYRYIGRATTVGKFVVPPTRAECMYEPEVFGRTAASAFEVR